MYNSIFTIGEFFSADRNNATFENITLENVNAYSSVAFIEIVKANTVTFTNIQILYSYFPFGFIFISQRSRTQNLNFQATNIIIENYNTYNS